MSVLEQIHARYSYDRRLHVLCDHLTELIPDQARVLDVGCGDGQLSHLIMQKRPDVTITGIDIMVRPSTRIPVLKFDGQTIPAEANAFDAVMFNDVLHHTPDPLCLLLEATRVAKTTIILKDHTLDGFLAGFTLQFMDRIGNARHGVVLPYNYWPKQKWLESFATLDLSITEWRDQLRLYPPWADWVFGRSLHFVTRLELPTKEE